MVKPTIYAALAIDYPADKISIHVLDDGRRPEFKAFCEEVGVNWTIRTHNRHAKAGNINEALKITKGEYLAIFDCDHIPTRSFLQIGLGWFLRDKQLSMLQTPHHFFSPDPFERNLGTFRKVPNEGELFYGLVQDGNDLWNATFFCGSCALLRRTMVEEIGGIAVETVTEDAHTALKLHRLGYTTAYLAIPQAAGLATESLSGHIGQRIRWARGMTQIFRIDNPLTGKGLKIGQRLCYLNAMMHFFYGIPRLVFLTAPLSYLFFGAHVIEAAAGTIAIYALPHMMHASITNSRMQRSFRHSFWAEVYESVLASYITAPTLLALINPKLGKFNVTAKGGQIAKDYFDCAISRPYLFLLVLNLLGFIAGIVHIYLHWDVQQRSEHGLAEPRVDHLQHADPRRERGGCKRAPASAHDASGGNEDARDAQVLDRPHARLRNHGLLGRRRGREAAGRPGSADARESHRLAISRRRGICVPRDRRFYRRRARRLALFGAHARAGIRVREDHFRPRRRLDQLV